MEKILSYINSRFNMHYSETGYDAEFINTLKPLLVEYFGMTPEVRIQQETVSIEMQRFIREFLTIEMDTTDCYVSNPTVINIKKELRGYTLAFRIRGLNSNKMLRIIELANKLIECQDNVNYPEEEE